MKTDMKSKNWRGLSLDAARVVLGHPSPAITEVYAELDIAKAAEVMERLG
jgi:hypothetical protein